LSRNPKKPRRRFGVAGDMSQHTKRIEMNNADSKQVSGDHYKNTPPEHQPWNVLQSWLTPEEYRGWQKGVAIVYLARERLKGGDTDVMKAAHHLEKLIEVMGQRDV
jgi:hypothetical protein